MSVIIHFKQVVLKQGLLLIVVISLLLSISLMLFSTFNMFFNYMISFITIISLIVVLFYANRYVPEQITINENNIVFKYFNKVFYKNKSKTYPKDELLFIVKGKVLIIRTKNTMVAEIKKKALSPKDWSLLIGLNTK